MTTTTTALWITQIVPDSRASRAARHDLRSAVAMHHRLMHLFPDGLGPEARRQTGLLFRVDDTAAGPVVLLQSALAPDLTQLPAGYGSARSKPLTPLLERVRAGAPVHYRITANATRKLGPNTTAGRPKQVVPLHGEEAEQWWRRQAERAGLHLLSVRSDGLTDATGERASDKFTITHARTRFDGVATVVDASALLRQLGDGIGRGKSYGCGLLTISPAS